jgi:Concanavalin A-like lectin/glucanases superfamily
MRLARIAGPLILAGGLASWACRADSFACQDDSQCDAVGGGQCELTGYCSFPDMACASGRRYGELATSGLAGECVAVDDATTSTGTDPSTSIDLTSLTMSPITTVEATSDPVTTSPVDSDSSGTGTGSVSMTTSTVDEGSSTGEPIPVDPDLLLWLRFEDDIPAVGFAADSSGNGRDFACVEESCPGSIPGPVGQAAAFDGVDDALALTYEPALDVQDAYTMAVWLGHDAMPPADYACVMGKHFGAGGENSYEIYLDGAGDLHFSMDAGPYAQTIQALALGDDAWTHVAATWDGAVMRLYFNGVEVGSVNATGPITHGEEPLTVGADIDFRALRFFWAGGMDDLRLYTRALDGDEIEALAGM